MTFAEAVKAQGVDAADVFWLLFTLWANDWLRVRNPSAYGLMALLGLILEDEDTLNQLDLGPLADVFDGTWDAEPFLDRLSFVVGSTLVGLEAGIRAVDGAIDAGYGWDPSPGDSPDAVAVAGRALSIKVNIPVEGGVSVDPMVTLIAVPKAHGGPGIVISVGGLLDVEIPVGRATYHLVVGANGAFTAYLGAGDPALLAGGTPSLALRMEPTDPAKLPAAGGGGGGRRRWRWGRCRPAAAASHAGHRGGLLRLLAPGGGGLRVRHRGRRRPRGGPGHGPPRQGRHRPGPGRRVPEEPARRHDRGALRPGPAGRHQERRALRRGHRPAGQPPGRGLPGRGVHGPVPDARAGDRPARRARPARRVRRQARAVPGLRRPAGHRHRPDRDVLRRRARRGHPLPAAQGHRPAPGRRRGQGRRVPVHRRRARRVRRCPRADHRGDHQRQGDRADHDQATGRLRGLVADAADLRAVLGAHRLRDLPDRRGRADRPAPPGGHRRAGRRHEDRCPRRHPVPRESRGRRPAADQPVQAVVPDRARRPGARDPCWSWPSASRPSSTCASG